MRPLTEPEVLNVWERGQARSLTERALLVLGAGDDSVSPEALARMCLGERDARLFALREQTIGAPLVGLARCPDCGETVELTFDAADVRPPSVFQQVDTITVTVAGLDLRVRFPNSEDLQAITGLPSVADSRRCLIERCVSTPTRHGKPIGIDDLPLGVIEAISDELAAADPRADVRLALSCPSCGRLWEAAFDIVSFFWSEIAARARRLMREVHTLARAYGWREADILAIGSHRRQVYLEMLDE